MYTVFHAPKACSTAIVAALQLSGAPYQIKTVDLAAKEQLSDEYLKINPLGKVPALETSEMVLTEGMAILLYLAEIHPESGLLSRESRERVQAIKWLSLVYSSMHPLFVSLFYPERVSSDESIVRQKASEALFKLFTVFDETLKQQAYLSGREIGVADLYFPVQLHWTRMLGLGVLEEFPSLSQYLDRIHTHPVVGSVYCEEFNEQI